MAPDRSTPRRAAARRFSLPPDPRWERVQRALLGAGAVAAALAVLQQLGMGGGAWLLAIVALGAGAALALPVARRRPRTLRWDGRQWWWDRPGEPLAVAPQVFIDLEQWMLLRLDAWQPEGDAIVSSRRSQWVAVSRRALGAQWSTLRLHLFHAPG